MCLNTYKSQKTENIISNPFHNKSESQPSTSGAIQTNKKKKRAITYRDITEWFILFTVI